MTGLMLLHPWRLVLLAVVPLMVVVWRRWPAPLPPGRSRIAIGLRLAILVALVLALAGVRTTAAPRNRAVVAVVDLSDSVANSEDEASAAVRAMARSKPENDLFGIVTFGHDARVELAPTRTPTFESFETRPDPTFSDLSAALRLAANLVPDGYGRQVVLLSDGRQNLGDAAATVANLRAQSVRVDVLPIGRPPRDEVLVAALDAPGQVHTGQASKVNVRLRATDAAAGTVTLQVDGRDAATRSVTLAPGDTGQEFDLPPMDPGTHRVRAVLDAQPDGHSQNNSFEAVVRVLDRPSVLLAETEPGRGANVTAALLAAGMQVDVRRPEDIPADPATLAGFDTVVLADVPADTIQPQALQALATNVRELGRGLVAIGGPSSYGPGGWKDTPLEEALPVRMDIPNRMEKPTVAVALLIETTEGDDTAALGAMQSVVDQLGPDDEIVVVGIDAPDLGVDPYIVPLSTVTDKEGIKERIKNAPLGDPPGYGQMMQAGLVALARSTAANKHMILIGDGDATADVGRYPSLLAGAGNVIVSTVGLDVDRNPDYMSHMRRIARLGGGRFYLSENQQRVPEIVLQASRDAIRPWYENQPFFPKVASAGDVLAGVPLDAFPELGGYVVTTPKADAEVALSSPAGDPVLADWQHGLGRAVAWTSDAQGRWTAGFLESPVSAALFARMVAWSLPVPLSEGLSVRAVPADDGLDVAVTATGITGEGGELQVDLVGPGVDEATPGPVLRPVAPNQWEGRVRADVLGSYVLHGVLRREGRIVGQTELTVAVPYSAEYLDSGRDDGVLQALARRGGTLVSNPSQLWTFRLWSLRVTGDWSSPLLLLAVVLWPLDVAVRRLTLTPRQLVSTLAALVRPRRRPEMELAAPSPAAELRGRLDRRRRHADGALPGSSPKRGTPRMPTQPAEPASGVPDRTEGAGAESAATRLLKARRQRSGERAANGGKERE
ncbi:MAG: VWA domain-containing protein [Actinomycetota bacterium]|nr:VWA domain-containing protein [Actinomycetota bacterium]